MLNTRDKILISLTAVLQAVYGAVFIYRMFAWKTLIAGGESDLLELEISLAALFAVTVIFSVIMRNLPAKIYSLPALLLSSAVSAGGGMRFRGFRIRFRLERAFYGGRRNCNYRFCGHYRMHDSN